MRRHALEKGCHRVGRLKTVQAVQLFRGLDTERLSLLENALGLEDWDSR